MRLEKLNSGHSLTGKLKLGMGRLILGMDPYDVVKMLMYRPEFLSARLNPLCQDIMRGPSSWSIGEPVPV